MSGHPCPCCGEPVRVPTVDVVVDIYKLPLTEAAILRAIWQGRGHPVMTDQAFDAMYADDPDGGPSPNRMYKDFKAGLASLRAALQGSGISIESAGYRQGYRLSITPTPKAPNHRNRLR